MLKVVIRKWTDWHSPARWRVCLFERKQTLIFFVMLIRSYFCQMCDKVMIASLWDVQKMKLLKWDRLLVGHRCCSILSHDLISCNVQFDRAIFVGIASARLAIWNWLEICNLWLIYWHNIAIWQGRYMNWVSAAFIPILSTQLVRYLTMAMSFQ